MVLRSFLVRRKDNVQVLGHNILKLVPDRLLKNSHVDSLALAMSEFWRPPVAIFRQKPDYFSFRIAIQAGGITFYLLIPERLTGHFKQKIGAVWEKATIKIVSIDEFPVLNPKLCSAAEMVYRRHDIFSFKTDKDENAPLTSLLSVSLDMKPDEVAIVESFFIPYNMREWDYSASKAYDTFQKGYMPHKLDLSFSTAGRLLGLGIQEGFRESQSAVIEAMGGKIIPGGIKDYERERFATRGLARPTTLKLRSTVIKTHLRIAIQSPDKRRADLILKAITGSYRDISGDNELIPRRTGKRTVQLINEIKPPLTAGILTSTAEAGKLMHLPTAGLQDMYPIESIKRREVGIPADLIKEDIPGIPLGTVTEKGIHYNVKIPLDGWKGIQRKHVYDALCTAMFCTGKVGCGKTEGMGINQAHGFVLNGFTAFLIDTADGELARKCEDSLPVDFPNDHIHHIDFDDKHNPVALNWADIASRQLHSAENDDLEAMEMAERLTGRLLDYVDGAAHAELTERMRQYLTSAARSTLIDPQKSLLDVELALRSPSYRERLLADPRVKAQIDVMQDIESLQRKAENGADTSIVDPIISRLKMFMETRALQNVFLQPNKLDNSGRPVLDFRKLADGDGGKYGHLICIHASQDAWNEEGQELVLSFVQDKILMAVLSRVDIPQDARKPVLNLVDEPHRFIKKAARLYQSASVEMRKYRMKLLWLAHYLSQMGPAAQAIASGGCQFIQYKTDSLKQFEELGHVFAPYEPEEVYQALPDKWEAVNKLRLPSGADCPAFIAKMEAPPKFVRSRDDRRKECAKQYGQSWKTVSEYIHDRRLKYQVLDDKWREEFESKKRKGGK